MVLYYRAETELIQTQQLDTWGVQRTENDTAIQRALNGFLENSSISRNMVVVLGLK